jgi:hypothetical protein
LQFLQKFLELRVLLLDLHRSEIFEVFLKLLRLSMDDFINHWWSTGRLGSNRNQQDRSGAEVHEQGDWE